MSEKIRELAYNSDFGLIPIGESVPDEILNSIRREKFEEECERVYLVGGNVGSGPMTIKKEPVYEGDGGPGDRQIAWKVYVVVPFDGEFSHLVREERFPDFEIKEPK